MLITETKIYEYITLGGGFILKKNIIISLIIIAIGATILYFIFKNEAKKETPNETTTIRLADAHLLNHRH